jgi:hypothetical protein
MSADGVNARTILEGGCTAGGCFSRIGTATLFTETTGPGSFPFFAFEDLSPR